MLARIPSISSWLHANTSRLSFRKLMIPSFVLGFRFVPIWVVFARLPSTNSIVSSFSTISGVFFLDCPRMVLFWGRDGLVTLPCQYLVSFYLPNPLFCWKFYLQTVRGSSSFPAVEGRSSNDHIVGRGWVYHQEIVFVGYPEGVWTGSDCQRHYPPRVYLVSTETDEGGLERMKPFWV